MSNQETTPIEDAEKIEEQPADEKQTSETPEAVEAEAPAEAAAEVGRVEELEQALAEAQKKAQEYFEGWQRERADFSNYKKRAERDLMTMRFNAKIDTLKNLLPVLDDFERAMANLPEELRDHAWPEGVSAIQRKLIKTLEDEGIQAIDPTGELFDPNLHEAIGRDSDTDVASEHVTVTLRKGYVCGDRVLRPALVRVAE
ncbi:MAG TPA: nucleotide exchange factor GrpE [Spirillospora sp.]|nr:nucleotide exchange factor GrpE [Spirillospora sp.]